MEHSPIKRVPSRWSSFRPFGVIMSDGYAICYSIVSIRKKLRSNLLFAQNREWVYNG
jgi:hypothetical protein